MTDNQHTVLACPSCQAVFFVQRDLCPLDGTPLTFCNQDPLTGTVIGRRYVIEHPVGDGSAGRVYRARHLRMSRPYAVKVMHGDHLADRGMRSRFALEAETASRLNHPNLVAVIDYGETERGLPFLVMDWVEGKSLADVVTEEAPFSDQRTLELLRNLARGLLHAHGRGVIHRDFKAENVLMEKTEAGEMPRIADFGIAVLHEELRRGNRITSHGLVVGTPAYMAPEQASGGAVDERTDLFALGVVLYEMLAGVLPFIGSGAELARKNLTDSPPAIVDRVPGLRVNPELEKLALRLMAKNPADRFQNAKALLAELDSFAGGRRFPRDNPATEVRPDLLTPTARTVEQIPQKHRSRGWRLAIAAGLLAGVAAVVSAVAVAPSSWQSPSHTPPQETPDAAALAAVGIAPARDAGPAAASMATVNGANADAAAVAAQAPPSPAAAPKPPELVKQARTAPPKNPAPIATAPANRPQQPHPPAPTTSSKPTRDDASNKGGISLDAFQRRYASVGRQLHALVRERGEAGARSLQARYLSISFNDAMANLDIRREAYLLLGRLEHEIARE